MALLVLVTGSGLKTLCIVCVALMVIMSSGCVFSAPSIRTGCASNLYPGEKSKVLDSSEPAPSIVTTEEPPIYKRMSQSTLYTGNDQTGRKETFIWQGDIFRNKECVNLPAYMQRRIRSINTYGTCVEVCETLGCKTSTCHRIHPGTPSHNRLKSLKLHNSIRSVRPCDWDGSSPVEQD